MKTTCSLSLSFFFFFFFFFNYKILNSLPSFLLSFLSFQPHFFQFFFFFGSSNLLLFRILTNFPSSFLPFTTSSWIIRLFAGLSNRAIQSKNISERQILYIFQQPFNLCVLDPLIVNEDRRLIGGNSRRYHKRN